jgi:hypothetical protein
MSPLASLLNQLKMLVVMGFYLFSNYALLFFPVFFVFACMVDPGESLFSPTAAAVCFSRLFWLVVVLDLALPMRVPGVSRVSSP